MRKLKLFLDAKAANTPPRGISKASRVIFSVLTLLLLSIGQVWGADVLAYTIEFQPTTANTQARTTSNFVSTMVTSGNSYISSCTATAFAYPDVNQIKLGSSSKAGSFTLSLSEDGQVKATKVVLSAKYYDSGKTITLTANSKSETFTPTNAFADYEVTLDGESDLTTISVAGVTASKGRMYVNAIKVYVAGGAAPVTPTCATPTFDPEDGETFTDNIEVEIASATDGATIYYTTDGEDPTTSSDVYTTALNFTETTTLKAMAVKEGSNNSAVATATYTKVVPFDGTILEITKDDFVASYASNNGEHKKNGVTYYTNQVCLSSSSIQFQKSNGLLYNKTDLGEIAKIEITKTGDNNLLVYSGTTENPTTGEVTGSASGSVTTYTFASGKGFFAIKCNSTALSQVTPIKIYYVYSAPAVVAPTISGETPFSTSTTVSITHADADHIYYTTNGVDPTTSSTEYTVPFTVDADGTTIVKAIAVKGGDVSAVASKEFEKVASYTTLADIFTKATEVGNTATDIYVTFGGWKVSAKTSNNVFLTDGTNGAVIYGSGHGFNAGDVLTGTVACKVQLYKGFAELTSLNSATPGLTVTPGSVGDPVVKTWDQLSAVNTGALVKLENLMYDGSKLTDGSDNTIPTYTTFYTASFESGKKYNLTGVYQYYNTNGQILPRNASDVVEIIETYTVTYNNAPDHGTLTIKNGDDVVASGSAVNEGTVLDIVTSPAEGYKLKEVQVNGSAYTETTLELTEDVVIAAEFELNEAPLVTSYILSEIGVETSHLNDEHVGDKVNLPLTAASCSKVFRGWDADPDCDHAPTYAPGAEITLAANNKFYAVYADAHVITPTDHALGSGTFNGTNEGGNTASEGYEFSKSTKGDNKAGYIQDSGTKDATIVFLQIKAESQIINEEPSAIILTAHLGAGSDKDPLDYPVYAVLVDADDNNVGDPVVLTTAIPKAGDDFSVELPTANYADVRGVKISHMKEDGWNVRYYSMSFKYQTGGTTYDNYSTDCQAQVATPVISGVAADGVYTEGKEISITCATAGATIYYAVDSDEEPSTEYTDAFTVDTDGAHTVKAKAVKAGMAASEIASVSFTINLPVVLSTMDQIFEAATAAGSTATDANIAFNNWVVSGVSTNGKNVFVTDGTKGFIIFNNGGNMGFAVGDVLSGTVACKVQLYNGAAELTTISSATEGLNIAKEGVITPAVKAITALSGINTGAAVTINSVQFDGTNLSDGANEIKPYNSLFAYEALESGKFYNVTGIYQQFGATKEILPRSAADIEEVSLSDPEISYIPASATIELGEELPGTVFANPHELTISYNSNNEAVATVSNTGVIALGTETGTAVITASFAGNATYAAANVTYTITVNPASVSENVVVLAEHNSKFYAMTTTITNETAVPVEVEYDGTKVTVAKEADKDAIQWTKKTIGENITFQTKDEDKLYLKGTSGGATLSLNATACNWAWNGTNNCYVTGTRGFIYRISTNGFKNYGVSNLSNADYVAPQVIVIDPANIVVTEKADAELAYTPAEVTLTVGGEFTPAVLSFAEGFDGLAAVTYASNNEAVATVDESGVVSLVADATGTATITATFAGNNNYLAGSASYVITVNEAGDDLTGVWVLASSVKAGDKIIIMGANNADIFTMGKQNANPNRAAVASTIVNNVLTPGAATKVFTLVDAGEGKFAIQASNGKYLTSATEGSNNSLLEAENYDLNNAKWTITIENGSYSIVAAAGNKTVMQYNSGSTLFSCYGSATQKPVKIYVQKVYTREVTADNYGTICLPQAGTITGATLYEIGSYENEMIYVDEVLSGELEAGKPYIFQATATELNVTYTSAVVEETAGHANGLYGFYNLSNENATYNIPEDAGNYILYSNQYWLVKGRAAYIANYRAYIKIGAIQSKAAAPGRRRVAMAVNGEQVVTGIDALNASEQPVKMIIDGQLFIIRGEKMYNANGQLVK
jgi:hypothetical protein